MHSLSSRPRAAACALVAAGVFVVLLVMVAAGWEPLHRADARVAADLHTWVVGHPGWRRTLAFLTGWVWDPWDFRALAAVSAVLLWWQGRRRTAVWTAAVMIIGGLTGTLVKVAVARDRPMFTDPVADAPGWSFPSGHALNGMLGCVVLLAALLPVVPRRVRPVLWIVAVVSVLGVGFTRMALGVHFLSDVVAGWALGVVVAVVLWAAIAALWDPAGTEPEDPSSAPSDDPEDGPEDGPADDGEAQITRGGDAGLDTPRPTGRSSG
ncbi:phosphatase PAP2 family protein [Uniformispora flossi]|uniref:phosphatase PAP2 family protein n=1 Tax=Uniformispora flossi TaxID=3390723 RepID=UPI003C2BF7B3